MYVTQKGMDRLNAEKADLAKKWCQHIARNKRDAAHSGSEMGSSVSIDGLEPYGRELKRRIADNKALLETARLAPVPTQTMMLAIGQIATIRVYEPDESFHDERLEVGGHGDGNHLSDPPVASYDGELLKELYECSVGSCGMASVKRDGKDVEIEVELLLLELRAQDALSTSSSIAA